MIRLLNRMNDKSIKLLLFFGFFALGLIPCFFLSSMTLPEEFTSAGAAAAILGKDWSGAIPTATSFGNLVRGVLLLPSMLIFSTPVLQYRFFLVTCTLLYSFAPPIVYSLAGKLGVESNSARFVISIVCGFSGIPFIYSHFLLSDNVAAFLIWPLVTVLLIEEKETGNPKRFFTSAVIGVISAVLYFMNPSLIAVFLAVVVLCIFCKITNEKTAIYLPAVIVFFAAMLAADTLLTFAAEVNGIYSFSGGFGKEFIVAAGSADFMKFLTLFFGRIYNFITAFYGFTVMSLALAFYIITDYIKKKKHGEKQRYSKRYVLLGVFCISASVLLPLVDAFLSMSDDITEQSVLLGSIGAEIIALPAIFLLFVHFMMYGLKYIRLMMVIAGTAVLEAVSMFIVSGAVENVKTADSIRLSLLFVLRPDVLTPDILTNIDVLHTVCMVFIVFAVLIPIVCCAKERMAKILSVLCSTLLIISSVYACFFAFRPTVMEGREITDSAKNVSEYIIADNPETQPDVVFLGDDTGFAMQMQYYCPDAVVKCAGSISELPDNCIVVCKENELFSGHCVLIGRTDSYNIYAKGRNTVMYIGKEEI